MNGSSPCSGAGLPRFREVLENNRGLSGIELVEIALRTAGFTESPLRWPRSGESGLVKSRLLFTYGSDECRVGSGSRLSSPENREEDLSFRTFLTTWCTMSPANSRLSMTIMAVEIETSASASLLAKMMKVGIPVGESVGEPVVGASVGDAVGLDDGTKVGTGDGDAVGLVVGKPVGDDDKGNPVGGCVGVADGDDTVGVWLGPRVGMAVGIEDEGIEVTTPRQR
jgi:hypothetical protein